MYETIACIFLVVILPYLFHKWITSAYYVMDKLFFAPSEQEEDVAGQPNVGSEEDYK